MSASVTFPLRYVLPTSALTLSATVRMAVVVDEKGGHLEPKVAVSLSAPWRAAPLTSAHTVGDLGGLDALQGTVPALAVAGSLRAAFDRAHPRTSALITDLSDRSAEFLAGLRMGENAADVVEFGRAIEVVHRELAAADRMRREWIARQGKDLRSGEWDLTAGDVLSLDACPATLSPSVEVPDSLAAELARDYGILVAIGGDDTDHQRHGGGHAVLAIYRRTPDVLPYYPPQDAGRPWLRDDALSRLRLLDADEIAGSLPTPRRPLDGEVGQSLSEVGQLQLDLLDCSDEYTRLAATHCRAEELAALQGRSQFLL
jgi:hypothetical protein